MEISNEIKTKNNFKLLIKLATVILVVIYLVVVIFKLDSGIIGLWIFRIGFLILMLLNLKYRNGLFSFLSLFFLFIALLPALLIGLFRIFALL